MCGICGELSFERGRAVSADAVYAMREQLVHRGPDADGLFVSADGLAGLGFRRLQIIDLTPSANQPMPNEDATIHLVFNGEIYNYRDLRTSLLARGHSFRSQSDSEVILHLYEEAGDALVDELEGMFAFALWDARRHQMVLARDRAGEKPLFVYEDARRLAFASEVKAFFAHPEIELEIDPGVLPSYFIHGYVSAPRTFYRNVAQIDPGSVMVVAPDGTVTRRRYWQLQYSDRGHPPVVPERREGAARVRQLVTQAVERQLGSDVPLGAFLSGGLDSTIVVGVMASLRREPIRTFSIGFEGDPAYDETRYARGVAERFHTAHVEFRVTPSAVDLLDQLLWHHDGPFGDSSAVPTYLVSRLTRQHVTVVLTGDGGDEVFAGYRRFQAALVAEQLPRWVGPVASTLSAFLPTPANERHFLSRARRFGRYARLPLLARLARWNSFFFDDLGELLSPGSVPPGRSADWPLDVGREQGLGRLSALAQLLLVNFETYLPQDLLVKTDRMTMATSLEARAPFLDRALMEYVATLPDDWKVTPRGRTKAILREAFADLVPPRVARRGKMGFGVPLDAWFRGALRGYMREMLLASDARYRQYLSAAAVSDIVTRHERGAANLGQQIWCLLAFERWLQLVPDWRTRRLKPVAMRAGAGG